MAKEEVIMRLDETYYLVMLKSANEPRLHNRLWPALHEMAWRGREGEGNVLYRMCKDNSLAMRLIPIAFIDSVGELCTTGRALDLEEKILFKGWRLRNLKEEEEEEEEDE